MRDCNKYTIPLERDQVLDRGMWFDEKLILRVHKAKINKAR